MNRSVREVKCKSALSGPEDWIPRYIRTCLLVVAGDWYYTTDFGAPEDRVFQDPNIDGLTPQQWQDRKDVLTAHLDNLPETMYVSLAPSHAPRHDCLPSIASVTQTP